MMVEDNSGSKTSAKNIGSWPHGFDIQTFFLQSLNIYIYIYNIYNIYISALNYTLALTYVSYLV